MGGGEVRRNGAPFIGAVSGVTGSTAVTRMVHTSTRGLESTQSGVEKILQECVGGETQHPEFCLPTILNAEEVSPPCKTVINLT